MKDPNGHDIFRLRDWFAGRALAGMCANSSWDDTFQPKNYALTASTAYSIADAMLAARNKEAS